MPAPRKQQIAIEATPYYHCMSRCVRHAYLCGLDPLTKKSYEHRRDWVEDRLIKCAEAFCIDVSAYAIMHNHYHLVLHINESKAQSLTDAEVIERWQHLYSGTLLTKNFLKGVKQSESDLEKIEQLVTKWRARLVSISWFMSSMNETIARKANAEEKCTGRFWEGRFNCQALLNEAAILACMAYVDLNPIRANVDETPETSDFTSIKQRIKAISKTIDGSTTHSSNTDTSSTGTSNSKNSCTKNNNNHAQPSFLMPFIGSEHNQQPTGINFNLDDYLTLVDCSGRLIREGKQGAIDNKIAPILERLKIKPENWSVLTNQFERKFKRAAGSELAMKKAAGILNKNWLQGKKQSAYLLS